MPRRVDQQHPTHVTRCFSAETTRSPRLPSFLHLVLFSPHSQFGAWSGACSWGRGSWQSSLPQLRCWSAVYSSSFGAQQCDDARGLAPVRCGWALVFGRRGGRWRYGQRVGRPRSRLWRKWPLHGPYPRAGRRWRSYLSAPTLDDLYCGPVICISFCRAPWLSAQRRGGCYVQWVFV